MHRVKTISKLSTKADNTSKEYLIRYFDGKTKGSSGKYNVLTLWLNYNSMHIIDVVKLSLMSLKYASKEADINLKLIVIDNNSQDGSYEVLSKFIRRKLNVDTIIIQTKRNWGFAGGVNLGYAIAEDEYDYLVLLNNDAVIYRRALAKIIQSINDNDFAGAQGIILRPNGEIDSWGLLIDELLLSHPIKTLVYNRIIHPTYLSGAFSIYSMDAIRKCIGTKRLFHEFVPAYFDDNILGLRLWNCGLTLAALPIRAALHLHGATFSKYSAYHVYNSILSYAVMVHVINTRFSKILWLVLLKLISRFMTKLKNKNKDTIEAIVKALREGIYYGVSLRKNGFTINLYKAPHIQIDGKYILKLLINTKIGIDMKYIMKALRSNITYI